MSLSEVLKNYENKNRARQKQIQSLRNELQKSIEQTSIQALKLQNHKVNHIHKNQQAIQQKLKRHQELLGELRKNQDLWSSLYEQLNRALMQVGDLAHYAGYIEAQVGELIGVSSISKFLEQSQNSQDRQEDSMNSNGVSNEKAVEDKKNSEKYGENTIEEKKFQTMQ